MLRRFLSPMSRGSGARSLHAHRLWPAGGALLLAAAISSGGCETRVVNEGDYSAPSVMGTTQAAVEADSPKQPAQLPAPLVWIGNGLSGFFGLFIPPPAPPRA